MNWYSLWDEWDVIPCAWIWMLGPWVSKGRTDWEAPVRRDSGRYQRMRNDISSSDTGIILNPFILWQWDPSFPVQISEDPHIFVPLPNVLICGPWMHANIILRLNRQPKIIFPHPVFNGFSSILNRRFLKLDKPRSRAGVCKSIHQISIYFGPKPQHTTPPLFHHHIYHKHVFKFRSVVEIYANTHHHVDDTRFTSSSTSGLVVSAESVTSSHDDRVEFSECESK